MELGYFAEGAQFAADFVNTKGWTAGREYLLAPGDVLAFLAAHGDERRVTKADLPKLRTLRDRVRAVFTAPHDAEARRKIDALLVDFPSRPRLAPDDGGMAFEPAAADVVGWVGGKCAIGLALFVAEHGTKRLGTCEASDCADAFVDTSKNCTKHCCSAKCTRLENVRAYRARRRVGT